MASKAEICVHPGDTQKELLNVSEISPSSLARFLEKQNPDLSFDGEPTYYKIFERIRSLTQPEQEKLLVGFYTEGVKDFPNGKTLGKFLARVNNIDWFKPKETPDQSLLEKLVQQHLSCLNLPSLPVRLIKKDWGKAGVARGMALLGAAGDMARNTALGAVLGVARDTALNTARDTARDTALGAARGTTWGAVWGTARGAARGMAHPGAAVAWFAAGDAACEAAGDAAWITVEDLMPKYSYYRYNKGSPFEPLIKIYERGCWSIGVVNILPGKKEFVIFVPSS